MTTAKLAALIAKSSALYETRYVHDFLIGLI